MKPNLTKTAARASWSAAALDRLSNVQRASKSARALAQSKSRRQFYAALCLLAALSAQLSTLHAQPAATSPVLDLDGKTGYVELPPNSLNDLTEATVEAWVKWRSFPTNEWARFISYEGQFQDTGIEGASDGGLHVLISA